MLAEIDRILPYLPAMTRSALPLGLLLLEWGPPIFGARLMRFTRMSRDEARAYLEGWLESRLKPRHLLVYGLRALVFVAFYQHPTVLAAMRVHWDRRLVETVRLRAETLEPSHHASLH